jgi:probable rRNA maturation factor
MSPVASPQRRPRAARQLGSGVAVQVRRATRQGPIPGAAALQRWAALALGRQARGRELSVLVVGPARSRSLNRAYRGKNHPTNVLAFPAASAARRGGAAGHGQLLGDLVICPQVLRREARAQGKAERAHWMHLVIHGTLHLIGYRHGRRADARRMERREVRLLRTLGVANPYRP